jgi:hypothetical protein
LVLIPQEITAAKYPQETLAKPGKKWRGFSAVCRCNSPRRNSPEKYFYGEVFLWRSISPVSGEVVSSPEKYFFGEVFLRRSISPEKYFSGEVFLRRSS